MKALTSKHSFRRTGSVLALSAGILLALAAVGCSSGAAQPAAGGPPPAEVSVAAVLQRQVSQWDEFTGRISAVETVELRPRVSGYIDRVAYKEGDEIKKGDLLFVIDQRPYKAALAQAQANLESARSEARLTRAQDARAKTLIEAQVISREEFEARGAANSQSEAAVRGAEAALTNARLNLQFTEVRAPVSGRAGRALVTVGNLAQADSTLLTTLVSLDPMYVYFDSDEQTYLRYSALARNGERAASANPVRVGLAGETGFPHTGAVDFVDNQVDSRTGTIRARAVLPNHDRVLTPGQFARVQVEGSGKFAALLIDGKALMTDQDRKFVWVVGADNTAQRRDLTVGAEIDGLYVVKSGLKPGDRVVVEGVQKVFFPGMPVKASNVAMDRDVAPATKAAAEAVAAAASADAALAKAN